MAWEKASPGMMALLAAALADYDCAMRKMFGSTAYFVKGNMFAGVLGDHIMLRMDEADRERIFEEYGQAAVVAPMGRRMREYVSVPHEISADREALSDWLRRSHGFAAALPPKEPKSKG